MLDASHIALSERVLSALRAQGAQVATAESCTGGLVAGALTSVAGSSDVVDRGFVTYSNAAKCALLGVDPALLEELGAVSEPVAVAMACGALKHSLAQVAVAITGVAGPGGGSAEKPVGHVAFALADYAGAFQAETVRFGDLGRDGVRAACVTHALSMLLRWAQRTA